MWTADGSAATTETSDHSAFEYDCDGYLNIRVNCIAPGSVMNAQTTELFYADKERSEAIMSHIPMHRPGSPEEIAGMTCFLASDDSSYMTGSLCVVDGGWICGYNRDF